MAEFAYVYDTDTELRNELQADPLYRTELAHMQAGRWQQAARTIAELDRRFPEAPELRQLRQQLSLHLSAERTWAPNVFATVTQSKAFKLLVIANLVIYPLLGVLYLLAQRAGLI